MRHVRGQSVSEHTDPHTHCASLHRQPGPMGESCKIRRPWIAAAAVVVAKVVVVVVVVVVGNV
ncbi:hypothetical protein E2C01_082896 [Portunus trituberculatus]|uniref:Uncharacterized protein n=1 Tax=Portunus trituberculatus TaxID=210409 RepID=A0A5B7J322_PORTR|nr:hypothetical protein [Portunus trituberculatus]